MYTSNRLRISFVACKYIQKESVNIVAELDDNLGLIMCVNFSVILEKSLNLFLTLIEALDLLL